MVAELRLCQNHMFESAVLNILSNPENAELIMQFYVLLHCNKVEQEEKKCMVWWLD
jgi:ATP-dependent protease Clp ATPase subunit